MKICTQLVWGRFETVRSIIDKKKRVKERERRKKNKAEAQKNLKEGRENVKAHESKGEWQ